MNAAAPTPILFLDFDGVLNHDRHTAQLRPCHTQNDALQDDESFDKACVARVNTIVEATDANVVISSAWRRMFQLCDLRGILKRHGFRGRVIAATPHLTQDHQGERLTRGYEIQAWLDKRGQGAPFAILDDMDDMAHLKPFHVMTDMATGVTDDDVVRAISLLRGNQR